MNRKSLKRIFHTYEKWEDYQNGMFANGMNVSKIEMAAVLLRDLDKLYPAMKYVSNKWKYASEVNLTNRGGNRQAWLGQAACCYAAGCTEYETRRAWGLLKESERIKANQIADRVIFEWEKNYFSGGESCLKNQLELAF